MAKIITTDFGAIHDALNKLIIGEVKAALRLVPGKKIESEDFTSLCRLVVSDADNYAPEDVGVTSAWLDKDDRLCFIATCEGCSGLFSEDDDMLDITDFHYLIEQLKDLMPESEYPHILTNAFDRTALDTAITNGRLCY